MKNSRRLLVECLSKIALPKSIEERLDIPNRTTVPAPYSKDEAEMYKDLLDMIQSDKKRELDKKLSKEFAIEELEEEVPPTKRTAAINNIDKTAAPKGVKDKALWNKIEKSVRESGTYKSEERIYKVVQKAYQKAGGEYTHKSKKSSVIADIIKAAEEYEKTHK